MMTGPPPLGCQDPVALPPPPPVARRQSCASFKDRDLLALAYQRIGLQSNGTAEPGSLFELHVQLHASACAGKVDIHKSGAPFLIWHRAFLYFHERALNQALLQDGTIRQDTLRLPFWQWDSVNSDFIPLPQPYTIPSTVLYRNRGYDPVNSAEANGIALQSMLGLRDFTEAQDSVGSVHGDIHLAFDDIMNDLMRAAGDPLFYAHHSEVDRLFEDWKRLHTDAWPVVHQTATFYDVHKNPGCYKLADFMHLENLGYTYEGYPLLTIDPNLPKLVVFLAGLAKPLPHHWAFLADEEPKVGRPFSRERLIGFGLPPVGLMHPRGRVPENATLAFLLQRPSPRQVWAATVTNKNEVLRVDEVKRFTVTGNLPDRERQPRL
jgi:Common central domain of tyrosinase